MKYTSTILAIAGTASAFALMRGYSRMAGAIMFGANIVVIGISVVDWMVP